MSKQISYTAEDYSKTKGDSPFRADVERHTIVSLLGDPVGLRILDAGCGEGIYARDLIDRGASYVIGVDGAKDFIDLANKKNIGYEGKIKYHQSFIQDFHGDQDLDVVVGSYVLSYPRDEKEAILYVKAISSHLKEGGKFVGFNNNPFEKFQGKGGYSKYGFEKEMQRGGEGGEVVYRIPGMEDPIVNFFLRPETYEKAFSEAGFSEFEWREVSLDPSSKQGDKYWKDFFKGEAPFVAMLAKK